MGRFLTLLRWTAPVLACVLFAIMAYNAVTSFLVMRADDAAPRDGDSGVLVGAEELDLGPPDAATAVLLVHGFIGGGSNFGALPARLASEGYRVRALRLPGHGTTPRDFVSIASASLLDHVLLESRSLAAQHETVILVGHSMGGALVTQAAAQEASIDGVALASPYFGVTHRWYYGLRPEVWSGLTGWALDWVYKGEAFKRVKRTEARPEILSYRWVPSGGSKTLIEIGREARNPELLSSVRCPLLVLHGSGDNAADPARAQQVYEMVSSRDKRFVLLGNSDHHLFYDYEREAVVDAIVTFIGRISDQS